MTDLDAILAAGPPRDEALCRRLAARIDPVWGFVAYGVLWFFAACMIATAVLRVGIALVGDHGPRWAVYLVLGGWACSFVLAWWPFGAWVSRRRAGARRLFREGVMLDAVIAGVDFHTLRGAPFTRATLSFEVGGVPRSATLSVGGHTCDLVAGATAPVLVEPGYRYCAVFLPDGAAVPAAY